MQPGVVPGAVLELHAAKASGGTSPGINDPLTTQWFDTSGSGNHGTLVNFTGTPWATGPDRLALDGADDVVTLPDLSACEDGTFTYEAWFRTTTTAAGNKMVLSENKVRDAPLCALLLTTAQKIVFSQWLAGWGSGATVTGPVVNDGQLHHAVGVSDGSAFRLYVDGVGYGPSGAPGSNAGVNAAQISGYGRAGDALFPGDIAAARIYPVALTAAQVAQNYHAGPLWTPARAVPVIGSPIVRGFGGTP